LLLRLLPVDFAIPGIRINIGDSETAVDNKRNTSTRRPLTSHSPTAAEENYAELLTVLIEPYEEEPFPIRAISPVEVLAELMASNGARSFCLRLFAGEHRLRSFAWQEGAEQAAHRKLGQRFKVSPAFF